MATGDCDIHVVMVLRVICTYVAQIHVFEPLYQYYGRRGK